MAKLQELLVSTLVDTATRLGSSTTNEAHLYSTITQLRDEIERLTYQNARLRENKNERLSDVSVAIISLLRDLCPSTRGDKVATIKKIRELTGLSLRDAYNIQKEIVFGHVDD